MQLGEFQRVASGEWSNCGGSSSRNPVVFLMGKLKEPAKQSAHPIDWIRQKTTIDTFLENRYIFEKYIYFILFKNISIFSVV